MVDGRFGAGTGPIWMDDVICSATETRLSDCQFGNWNNSDCTHQEDVGVICPVSTGVSPSTQRPTTTPSPVVPGTGNCKPLSNRNVCKVDEISFGNLKDTKFNDLALCNSLPNECLLIFHPISRQYSGSKYSFTRARRPGGNGRGSDVTERPVGRSL